MITVTAYGRIGRDAELRHTANGKAVRSFSIAVDRGFSDNKTTDWYKVVEFGKRAENGLIQYLKKGTEIVVTGALEQSKWTDKQGQERLDVTIVVRDIKLVGGRKEQQQTAQQPPQVNLDDPLPF